MKNASGLCRLIAPVILAFSLSSTVATVEKVYGKPLTGTGITKISELLENADRYDGKTVRVEGVVTGVCEKRGCWISLAADHEFEDLQIKVDDGVIVFPVQALGKRAIAEGIFIRIEMNLEQTLRFMAHRAEEDGTEFDPSSVTEPATRYQIKATGAIIR